MALAEALQHGGPAALDTLATPNHAAA